MGNSICEHTITPGTKPSGDNATARIIEGLDLLAEEMLPFGKLLICPFCEGENQEDFEIYFVADREYEVVDVCHKCRRYVPTVDLRKRPKPIAREIAGMALMHLDVIAQERGFLPVAVCAWNIVRNRDVISVPVRLSVNHEEQITTKEKP